MRCNLCDSEDIEIIFFSKKKVKVETENFVPTSSDFGIFYDLLRCKNCNILFSSFDEKKNDLKSLYSDSMDTVYLSQAEERLAAYKRVFSQIKSFLPLHARFLDIGCSYGGFLNLARENGWQVYGVELSKHAGNYCRDLLGLDVFKGDLWDAVFSDNYFDVIAALELIEHIPDPKNFISRVHILLKPGGILYLATPDVESFSSKLTGYGWWSYRSMHLYYFSRKTLSDFLTKNGFSVINSRPYQKNFKLSYIMYQLGRKTDKKLFYRILCGLVGILRLNNLNIKMSFGDVAIMAKKQ